MATNSKDTFTERNPYLVYSDEFEDTKTDIMTTVGNMLEDTAITLSSEAVRAFDTVAEMQACTSLIVGMICHTNGFHAAGDGGAAFYKISASGTADGINVIACGDVFANLVKTDTIVIFETLGNTDDDRVTAANSLSGDITLIAKSSVNTALTLDIGNKNVEFDKWTYTGDDAAFKMVSGEGRCCIGGHLISSNVGISQDLEYHQGFASQLVDIAKIESTEECFYANCTLGFTQYCVFRGLYWKSTNADIIKVVRSAEGWTWFNDIVWDVQAGFATNGLGFYFDGGYAIDSTTANVCDKQMCRALPIENTNGIYLANVQSIDVFNARIEELTGTAITLVGDVSGFWRSRVKQSGIDYSNKQAGILQFLYFMTQDGTVIQDGYVALTTALQVHRDLLYSRSMNITQNVSDMIIQPRMMNFVFQGGYTISGEAQSAYIENRSSDTATAFGVSIPPHSSGILLYDFILTQWVYKRFDNRSVQGNQTITYANSDFSFSNNRTSIKKSREGALTSLVSAVKVILSQKSYGNVTITLPSNITDTGVTQLFAKITNLTQNDFGTAFLTFTNGVATQYIEGTINDVFIIELNY